MSRARELRMETPIQPGEQFTRLEVLVQGTTQRTRFELIDDQGSGLAMPHHVHEKEEKTAILAPNLHEEPIAADGFAVARVQSWECCGPTQRECSGQRLKGHWPGPVIP
jgi:hypothetical protein